MRSREYDLEFRDRSARIRNYGIGLLSVAGLLWAWCAMRLLTPYTADESPDRLAETLALLGLSLPVSLVGVALFTHGNLSRRMSAHSQAMRELDGLADERER